MNWSRTKPNWDRTNPKTEWVPECVYIYIYIYINFKNLLKYLKVLKNKIIKNYLSYPNLSENIRILLSEIYKII